MKGSPTPERLTLWQFVRAIPSIPANLIEVGAYVVEAACDWMRDRPKKGGANG